MDKRVVASPRTAVVGSCVELLAFYEQAEIFLTGGSGVVGKALIEKLLRSCNVRRIYLLLRPRKNLTVEQRLEKVKNAKIFSVVRRTCPAELDKLVAIPGDVCQPLLGITPSAAAQMAHVSIVFHCAATVRFDEPLRVALTLNVGGTYEALKFAQTLRQLKIFMHVSTFYSNPYLEYVEPKVYAAPMDWRLCLQLAQLVENEDMLDALTNKMTVGFPNTYTFTKNLAESLVQEFSSKLPVVIYRPSIVLFGLREPVPGFSPSLIGAMGLFVVVGAGILKTVYLGDDVRLDITPLDVGIKLMLHYAHAGYMRYQSERQSLAMTVPVFQSSSYGYCGQSFKVMASQVDTFNLWEKFAFDKCFMIPGCTYTANRWHYLFLVFTKQIAPAALVDCLLLLFGRKPVLMGIVRKVFITLEVMQPFMFNNYESSGTCELPLALCKYAGTEFDLQDDYYNVQSKWRMAELCESMVESVRRDLLNEDPSTIPRAQRILKIKQFFYFLIRTYLIYKVVMWLFGDYICA